jgi:hypothetical protein
MAAGKTFKESIHAKGTEIAVISSRSVGTIEQHGI